MIWGSDIVPVPAHSCAAALSAPQTPSFKAAQHPSCAAGVVDVCLIPEVKFEVKALTAYVREVMKRKGHCVVCIAEGAGQDIVQHGHAGKDKSGNPILKDIGTHLRDAFKETMQVCLSQPVQGHNVTRWMSCRV